MSFEMRAFGVDLVATSNVAPVNLASLQRISTLAVHPQADSVASDATDSYVVADASTACPQPGRGRRSLVEYSVKLKKRNRSVDCGFGISFVHPESF